MSGRAPPADSPSQPRFCEREPKFFRVLAAGRIFPVPRAAPDTAAAVRWDSGPGPRTGAGFPERPNRTQVRSRSQRLRASSSSVTPGTTVATTAPPARSAARQFFEARREFPQTDRSRPPKAPFASIEAMVPRAPKPTIGGSVQSGSQPRNYFLLHRAQDPSS
jgi:hypothetical protein